jgi:hypothetical protein
MPCEPCIPQPAKRDIIARMMGHRSVSTTLARYNKYVAKCVSNLTKNEGSAFDIDVREVDNAKLVRYA